MSLPFRTTS